MSLNPQENNQNKSSKQKLIVIISSLVVLGIILYGSISLYNKLNKVNELNDRITEAAERDNEPAVIDVDGDDNVSIDTETAATESPHPAPVTAEGAQQPAITLPTAPTITQTHTDDDAKAPVIAPVTTPIVAPTAKPDPALEKAQKKKEIDAKVTVDMQQLRASCQAESSSLVAQIKKQLEGNSESILQVIQDQFLSKITSAESSCDAKFDEILSSAKDEYSSSGISDQSMPDWGTQYSSAKSEARTTALNEIANAIK